MTDTAKASQTQKSGQTKTGGKLSRGHLENTLNRLLAEGPSTLSQQVRYILAISQLTAARSTTAPNPETPATVPDARLAALVDLSRHLTDEQKKHLYQDLNHIGDDDIQLQLILQLLRELPHSPSIDKLQQLWQRAGTLKNPTIRTHVYYAMAPLLSQSTTEDGETVIYESPLPGIIELAKTFTDMGAKVRSLIALALQLSHKKRVQFLTVILRDLSTTKSDTLRMNIVNGLADHTPPELETQVIEIAENIIAHPERARALTLLSRKSSHKMQAAVQEKALTAIGMIENEEERTQALAAFAPNLEPASADAEFPELLEHALAIAITLTRRHFRAKALVSLAPHLTLDLQGEALAAVHSLSSERERAMLLAELAPTLPPNMVVASLAVAHTMREQDSRVHALTVLAHYAPQQARSQTLLDALAAATNLPHQFERVTALLGLVDILPDQLLHQAFTNALETTRGIENENSRARSLSMLGQALPPQLVNMALEEAYHLENPEQRLNALTGIIPRINDHRRDEVLRQMLNCAHEMTIEYKKARAIISIASHLSQDLIPTALDVATELDDPFDSVNAYIAIAQNMPPNKRPDIIKRARDLLDDIDDGYDRASSLAAIAPYLPEAAKSDLALRADAVIRYIKDEYDKASAITIVAHLLPYRVKKKKRIRN